MHKLLEVLEIDHIGIAVLDIEKALKNYTEFLGFKFLEEEIIQDQNVRAVFMQSKNSSSVIELIAAHGNNKKLDNFFSKKGEGLHHICYKVANILESLKQFEQVGVRLIDKTPRIGARNKQIAFLHPVSFNGVLVEICQ